MIHDLKVHPQFWAALSDGRKPFEVRRNDRPFKVGDVVELRYYDPRTGYRTGADWRLLRRVTFILTHEDLPGGVPRDFCVLGFREQ